MELLEIRSIPISDAAVSMMIWELYETSQNICNIPISDASMRGWYGNYMELCQIHSIPIQVGQGSYGIGMGLIHIIPIPDTMGNLWNCAKYVAIP